MAEIADVVFEETIEVEWGNAIRDRTVQRYEDSAARASEHPSPDAGDLSFLEDTGRVFVWDGGAWLPVGPATLAAGSLEVDGRTVVASTAIGSTPNVEATVALTIPTSWAEWKCYAIATGTFQLAAGTVCTYMLSIDGADQQPVEARVPVSATPNWPFAVAALQTGLVTTGSRNITLWGSTNTGVGSLDDVTLYARAVRTL